MNRIVRKALNLSRRNSEWHCVRNNSFYEEKKTEKTEKTEKKEKASIKESIDEISAAAAK